MTRAKDISKIVTDADLSGTLDVTGAVTVGNRLSLKASLTNPILFENQHGVTTDAAISTFDDSAGTLISFGSNYFFNSSGGEERFNTGEESSGVVLNRTGTVQLKTGSTGATAVNRLIVDSAGDISFYEDTGTTPKLFWDASEEALGIGTSSPLSKLTVAEAGNITTTLKPTVGIIDTTSGATMTMRGQSPIIFFDCTSGGVGKILTDGQGLEIKDGTLDSQGNVDFKIASNGNVGIGTSSPASKLHLYETNAGPVQIFENSDTAGTSGDVLGKIEFKGNDTTSGANGVRAFIESTVQNTSGGNQLRFGTANSLQTVTERMIIRADGAVGIGTSVPSQKLDVAGKGVFSIANPDVNGLQITATTGTNASAMTFSNTATAYVGLDNSVGGRISGVPYGLAVWNGSAYPVVFGTNGSERMRIDSSGNLLLGVTGTNFANQGFEFRNNSYMTATNSGDKCAVFNRLSTNGDILQFYKDTVQIGKIGTPANGDVYLSSGNIGLLISGSGTVDIYPCDDNGSARDNVADFGQVGARWDDIYATNGTIQTSDRNEKQDIEQLSDAEQRVAVVAKGLMRKFRWIDSVAEKGDNARTHFGIIAQDLQDAFTAEGLDAGDYAMFTSTTWWEKEISVDAVEADEENGIEAKDAYTYIDTKEEATEGYTERTRLGVRYNQLLAFIISAI